MRRLNDHLMALRTEKGTAAIAFTLLELAADAAVAAEIPDVSRYAGNLLGALDRQSSQEAEQALIDLYVRLHVAGSAYSPAERILLDRRSGYSSHPGGLQPLLAAGKYIGPGSVVADLGAGNGLQGLLLQRLYPHRKTLQVELCGDMIRVGRLFQRVLGIGKDRVEWLHDDILNAPFETADFVYIYRPSNPVGRGRDFYRQIAGKLAAATKPLVVLSVADCLAEFLDGCFSVAHSDGHLTCFLRKGTLFTI